MTQQAIWQLEFDGERFLLEPSARADLPPTAKDQRPLEENIETLLLHWGGHLLPGMPVRILGRSPAIVRSPDLTGIDDLGRLHLFELKKDRANEHDLAQLLAYVINRPTRETQVDATLADTLWNGETAHAASLAAFVARKRLSNTRASGISKKARGGERLVAHLDETSRDAGSRSGLRTSPDRFRELAKREMKRLYGLVHDGPLPDTDALIGTFKSTQLPSDWLFGRTEPPVVMWLIAPDVDRAADAASEYIERGIDVRCVSLDIHEVQEGREWLVGVQMVRASEQEGWEWQRSDAFGGLLLAAMREHIQAHPGAAERARLRMGDAPSFGWQLARPVRVDFTLDDNSVTCKWYSHWWTEGRARLVRDRVNDVRKKLPDLGAKIPWNPEAPADDQVNRKAAERIAAIANNAWEALYESGATGLGRWAYYAPEV